jgi:hypothetical protein
MAANDPVARGLQTLRGIQDSIARIAPTGSPAPQVESVSATASPALTTSPVSQGETAAPTAFVSWAHSHPTWTPEQTSDWESQVAAFAAMLRRRFGIRADVDLFHLDETVDWTRYGPQQIQEAKFTLVVMSKAWAERWAGTNSPCVGAGAAAEADTLRGLFSQHQENWQRRVVVVMFPDVDTSVVPADLQRATRVSVDPVDADSFEGLIRLLTDQPRYPKPPVGEIPVFEAANDYGQSLALMTLRERLAEIEKRKGQIKNHKSASAETERQQLTLSESATRGFIDAELTIED